MKQRNHLTGLVALNIREFCVPLTAFEFKQIKTMPITLAQPHYALSQNKQACLKSCFNRYLCIRMQTLQHFADVYHSSRYFLLVQMKLLETPNLSLQLILFSLFLKQFHCILVHSSMILHFLGAKMTELELS